MNTHALPTSLVRKATALTQLQHNLPHMPLSQTYGKVEGIQGPLARVCAPDFKVGNMCEFLLGGDTSLLGEVIGLQGTHTLVTPLGPIEGIGQGTLVRKLGSSFAIPFSNELLGRVVSGLGAVIGDPIPPSSCRQIPIRNAPPDPIDRAPIDKALCTGLRVVDGTMTLAQGQRIALIGPPGAGKSTLLAAMTANSDADVVVFGLIGERGREISDFVTRKIPEEVRQKLVIVAAPADRPALERLYAANTATAIAEGFRDQGKSVLLVIDSLTRVARAMREVGLAAGEPPTRRGYPASVFAQLPELIERPGTAKRGVITAIYSVLSEGSATDDPIAEEVRSLVDGHILLDAKVFAAGRFPAINVTDSLSRLMPDVVSQQHAQMNTILRNVMTKYREIELLVQVGEYRRGQDAEGDRAIDLYPQVVEFLSQSDMSPVAMEDTLEQMRRIFS